MTAASFNNIAARFGDEHSSFLSPRRVAEQLGVTLAELAREPLILTDQAQSWQHMLELFQSRGVRPQRPLGVPDPGDLLRNRPPDREQSPIPAAGFPAGAIPRVRPTDDLLFSDDPAAAPDGVGAAQAEALGPSGRVPDAR